MFYKFLPVFCCLTIRTLANEGSFETHEVSINSLGKLTSLNIDESLNGLRQDDPKLIQLIRDHYLIPPSNLPYNFSNPDLPKLQGQFGQAKYVADTFFSSNTNGKEHFFFEAGAFDGELLSNSLLFETKLGWSGVLVEPNPVAFGMLLTKHRKAWSINTCLSRRPYPEVISFDMDGLTGGIINENDVRPSWFQKSKSELDKITKVFWESRGEQDEYHRWDDDVEGSVKTEKFQLQCLPLYSILKALNVTHVDYLSLDVEGSEYGILEAAFKHKDDWNFNVASIEQTYQSLPAFGSSRLEMIYLLRSNGYWMQNHISEDDIYVNRNNTYFLEIDHATMRQRFGH